MPIGLTNMKKISDFIENPFHWAMVGSLQGGEMWTESEVIESANTDKSSEFAVKEEWLQQLLLQGGNRVNDVFLSSSFLRWGRLFCKFEIYIYLGTPSQLSPVPQTSWDPSGTELIDGKHPDLPNTQTLSAQCYQLVKGKEFSFDFPIPQSPLPSSKSH